MSRAVGSIREAYRQIRACEGSCELTHPDRALMAMAEGKQELWMSVKDRDRLKVWHEVSRRHITQVQAARELGGEQSWVRPSCNGMKQEGDNIDFEASTVTRCERLG